MNELINRALVLSFYIAGIPLAVVTFTGLIVSVLQAATQIQDQTISIVPKMLSIVLVLFVLGSWMMGELQDFFLEVLRTMPTLGRSVV
jgi:flagellar biosynthetic protein FliQ